MCAREVEERKDKYYIHDTKEQVIRNKSMDGPRFSPLAEEEADIAIINRTLIVDSKSYFALAACFLLF